MLRDFQVDRAARALHSLEAHHTNPCYKVPLLVVQRFVDNYGYHPMTWHQQKWGNNAQNRGKRKSTTPQEKDKPEKSVEKFPAYDRGHQDTGGSAPSSAASLPPSVVTLLQSVAEKDSKAAEALEGLLPDATSVELKSRQRHLNAVRKAKQKLDRKESTLAKKEALMVRFLEETRQHVLSEKARHKSEVETLKQEIIDAREALERAKSGQQEEDDGMGQAEDDLDAILGQEQEQQLQKENQELKEQIQRMTVAQRQHQTQMYDMQARMEEFMRTFADRKNEVVKPELAMAMGVFNGTPVDLEAMDTAPTTPSRTHPALQPFRGGGRNSNRPSPYGTEKAKGDEPKPSTT